jgi:HlyD family secretion protein
MKKRTKLAIAIGVPVLVGAAVVFSLLKRGGDGVDVRLEPVARRNLEAVVSGNGYIRPHRRVDVQADIMGRVIELRVNEGQAVQRGQLLLRIDPAEYEAAVQRAHADVSRAQALEAQAEANLIQAERAYQRTSALAAAGEESLVSRQVLEEAETQVRVQKQALEAARFGVAQARAMLGEASDRLSRTVIRAPMDGVVTRLNVDEGETAIVGTMNNPGSLLLTVADLSIMEAVIRVDETDLPDLAIGDSAAVQIDAFPRRTFVGRVSEISHSSVRPPGSSNAAQGATQGQAVDYEIVITIENPPPGLRSDLSATADIVTEIKPNALSIPIIALTVRERGDVEAMPQEDPAAARAAAEAARDDIDVEGVFVLRDDQAHFVPVQVGIAGREHFEVISGLTEKDSVIAGPYEAIRALQEGDRARRLADDTAGARPVRRTQS